jgi:hypothetical protein
MKSGRRSLPDFFIYSNGVEEMANEKNLIPMNERTEEEQREIARKGGIASGASRRAYRSLKQAAKAFFKENDDAAMRMIQALYEEAEKGNVKAIDKLQDLIGETVQREELALKKKQFAQQNGQKSVAELPQLLQALQEDDAE